MDTYMNVEKYEFIFIFIFFLYAYDLNIVNAKNSSPLL